MKIYQAPRLCFVLFQEKDIVRTSGVEEETELENKSNISDWFGS